MHYYIPKKKKHYLWLELWHLLNIYYFNFQNKCYINIGKCIADAVKKHCSFVSQVMNPYKTVGQMM
jgi:hypothetical protein